MRCERQLGESFVARQFSPWAKLPAAVKHMLLLRPNPFGVEHRDCFRLTRIKASVVMPGSIGSFPNWDCKKLDLGEEV